MPKTLEDPRACAEAHAHAAARPARLFGGGKVSAESSPYGSGNRGWDGAHTATVRVVGLSHMLSSEAARELAGLLVEAADAAEELRRLNESAARLYKETA